MELNVGNENMIILYYTHTFFLNSQEIELIWLSLVKTYATTLVAKLIW